MTCPLCQRELEANRYGNELRAYCEGCGIVVAELVPPPGTQPDENDKRRRKALALRRRR